MPSAPDHLSTTLAALSDPTRRAILARLATGQATVTQLAAPFAMSMPAVSRHLKVLEHAGLIARGRVGADMRPAGAIRRIGQSGKLAHRVIGAIEFVIGAGIGDQRGAGGIADKQSSIETGRSGLRESLRRLVG